MSKSRARVRARTGKEARVRVERVAAAAGGARPSLLERMRTGTPVSRPRIAINVALLVFAIAGAGLQLIEARREVPGDHRLWLAVYLFIVIYAAATLALRLRGRKRGAK